MAPWTPKYSDEQREAVISGYLDRGIRPARKVAELAARGELRNGDTILEPFEIPVLYVNELARGEKRRRLGRAKSGLNDAEPRDAVEALRRRLVSAADNMLTAIEKRQGQKRQDPKDPELLRQIARAVREVAAIPGPNEPRPVPPGQKVPGTGANNGDRTAGGLAGTILTAHRNGGVHTPDEDPRQSAPTDEGTAENASAAQHHAEQQQAQADDAPGSWLREQVGL